MLDSNSWSVTLRESRSGNLRKITVAREHHCLMRKRGSSVGMGTTGRRWCTGGSIFWRAAAAATVLSLSVHARYSLRWTRCRVCSRIGSPLCFLQSWPYLAVSVSLISSNEFRESERGIRGRERDVSRRSIRYRFTLLCHPYRVILEQDLSGFFAWTRYSGRSRWTYALDRSRESNRIIVSTAGNFQRKELLHVSRMHINDSE